MIRITLKDIAEEAGVSVSTVSYVLNKRGRVTKEKHKRIIEIANKYSYVPDANAKGLVTGINNNIGLLVNKGADTILQQPFVMKCISEFSKYLRKDFGWLSLCMVGGMQVDMMRNYLANANFDGIIILFAEHSEELAELLSIRKTPCVYFDSFSSGKNIADIGCDEEQGIKASVDHLAALGHKRITFLSAKAVTEGDSDIRQSIFRKTMRAHGFDDKRVVFTGYERKNVYQVLRQIFQQDEKPTAFVTPSDKIAWSAIDFLRERNIKVPEEISVVGFDDADEPQNEEYGLTTIRQPVAEMVKASVDCIYASHDANELMSLQERFKPTLIVRETTAKCSEI